MTPLNTVTLTDGQADALRILVEVAPASFSLGRRTDPAGQTINSRVGRALIQAGLATWQGGQPDGFVLPTEAGIAWVHDNGADPDHPDLQPAPVADQPPPPTTTDTGVPLTYNGRDIVEWKTKIKTPAADAIHGTIPQLPVGSRVVAVVVLSVEEDAHWHLGMLTAGRRQTMEHVDLWPVPHEYGAALVREIAALVDDEADQPRLPLDRPPAGDPAELIDRLNREELEVRDDKGRREWPSPGDVDRDRVREVADLLIAGGPDGYPARSLDLPALATLVKEGTARVEPIEYLSGLMVLDDDAQPWAWWTGHTSAFDTAVDLLETAEEARPQYRVRPSSDLPDLWVVVTPGGMEAPGAYASEADAIAFIEQRAGGPLEWRRDRDELVADAQTEDGTAA